MRSPIAFVLVMFAVCCGAVASFAVRGLLDSTDHTTRNFSNFNTFFETASRTNSNIAWPPVLNEPYPNLQLQSVYGQAVQLSDYKGKTLLIEPVGMSCRGCQAFAGGHKAGGIFGEQPQAGLKSIHEYVEAFSPGLSLTDQRITKIQILFYGPDGRTAPNLEDALKWSKHFQTVAPGTIVLIADASLLGSETYQMIPGFQLVDQDFVLRCDAGNPPRQDLYRELIPMLGKLLNRR